MQGVLGTIFYSVQFIGKRFSHKLQNPLKQVRRHKELKNRSLYQRFMVSISQFTIPGIFLYINLPNRKISGIDRRPFIFMCDCSPTRSHLLATVTAAFRRRYLRCRTLGPSKTSRTVLFCSYLHALHLYAYNSSQQPLQEENRIENYNLSTELLNQSQPPFPVKSSGATQWALKHSSQRVQRHQPHLSI